MPFSKGQMSFFIQSPKAPELPTDVNTIFPASSMSGPAMLVPNSPKGRGMCPEPETTAEDSTTIQLNIDISYDTLPPMASIFYMSIWRWYIYPLSETDPSLVGIFTQYFGRTWWLVPYPQDTNGYPLRLQQFPTGVPLGPPSDFGMWQMGGFNTGQGWVSFKNSKLLRYLQVNPNTDNQGMQLTQNLNEFGHFVFMWKTSLGPVVPTPIDTAPVLSAKYYIRSKYHKALKWSTASGEPYLTQVPMVYDDSSTQQMFYFRAVQTPDIAHQGIPFTYNMYFNTPATDADPTMLCFEQNGSISIRNEAGPWEEFKIIAADPESGFFPGFKIESFAFDTRLRASADGTVSTVSKVTLAETAEDYFFFCCAAGGNPYANPIGPGLNEEESTKTKQTKCCSVA